MGILYKGGKRAVAYPVGLPSEFFCSRVTFAKIESDTLAGTEITLPKHAWGFKKLIYAYLIHKVGGGGSHTHAIDYVKGTATTYVPDDSTLAGTSLAASATISPTSVALTEAEIPNHLHLVELAVVETAPSGDQIQLKDERTVVLGRDVYAGEMLILIGELHISLVNVV
jgi:hypothetical protein